MIKAIFFPVILLVSVSVGYSQIPVGYRFDVNGVPFNGYYDAMTYGPVKELTERHLSDSYEVGYYYDKSGNKISGNIKFQGKKIFFRQGKEEFRDKIKPEDVETFVIGVDSFFTISKYLYRNDLKTQPVYVQFIAAFDDYVFAKHYYFPTIGSTEIVETFMVKSKDRDVWVDFPDNKTFKTKALAYFGHIPYLEQMIKAGKYKSDNMLAIVKMAQYLRKYENHEEIFYDKYWEETRDSHDIVYKARITAKEDSIWTFEYYADDIRLYQVKYSAFYPNMKNGELICYYPTGAIRQVVSYKNNKVKEVKTFAQSGSLDRHYQVVEDKKDRDNIDYKYLVVNDDDGNNILKPNAKSTIAVRDEVSGFTYTSVFKGDKMVSAYRLADSDTVFQIVDPDFDFSLKGLSNKFSTFMSDKTYEEALSVNAQGKVLVSLLVDPKGYALKATVLNKIHPEIDKIIAELIHTKLLEGSQFRYKIDVYKKDKVSRYCEVVIPIDFSTLRFYRKPVNYYQMNHMQWHMQQQMMMQPPPVRPPSFH